MCMRDDYPPVFLTSGKPPFLDDLIGKPFADSLRTAVGYPVTPQSPFGVLCGGDDSYLTSALSSPAALFVVLAAFVTGLICRSRRRLARWIVALCIVTPPLILGARIFFVYQREARHPAAGEFLTDLIAALPAQMLANVFFQFLVPFVLGLTLSLLASGSARLLTAARSRLAPVER